jgi:hypothetical protein
MLSRPATKISLTSEDLLAFEKRREARERARLNEMDSTQETTTSINEDTGASADLTPAAQAKATRSRPTREQRIGVSRA